VRFREDCETPVEAGVPRTAGPTREYRTEGITVVWNATRCIHSADCIKGLPRVFDPRRRPWVDPTAAEPTVLAEVIRRCPTGALTYKAGPGMPPEEPDDPATVRVLPDGPLLVRGRVEVRAADGTLLAVEPRVALCRCGASENKPFCDNSHRRVRFRDRGLPAAIGAPQAAVRGVASEEP
jgi:uncharacterized Fe-S cluster protein YjdI/CDGSH-type Zn-finger protein